MKTLLLTSEGPSADLISWLTDVEGDEVITQLDKITPEHVDQVKPDFMVSYNYRYIIKEEVLNLLPDRAINMHISLLPWNRGADPNFWSIVEGSPKGVTIHRLDKGVDTGEILVQTEVEFDFSKETLTSSYLLLHQEIQKLFKENWSRIKSNSVQSVPQSHTGSTHLHQEFLEIQHILGEEGWDIPVPLLIERCKDL